MMATQNALNNKSASLTLDPGASGDSFIQLDINSTGEFRIGVDDTDDSFRISQGSALGTSDTFIMTAAGENTMPLQSCFGAYLSSTQSNVTGDTTVYTVPFDAEIFDQNSDFNTTNGTFTAPVDGVYKFFSYVQFSDYTASNTRYILDITITGGPPSFRSIANLPILSTDIGSFFGGYIVKLDASDTAIVQVRARNTAKVVDVVGSSSPYATYFYGYLAC